MPLKSVFLLSRQRSRSFRQGKEGEGGLSGMEVEQAQQLGLNRVEHAYDGKR